MDDLTVAVTPLPDLSASDLAKLAREIVMDIRDTAEILATFNLSQAQFDRLKAHPTFKQVLETLSIEWHSALSTEKRLKISSAAILEEALPSLGTHMMDRNESLRERVEAGKLFAKMAGVGEGAHEQIASEKFVINIDLGGDTKLRLEKEQAARTVEGIREPIQENPEGERSQPAISYIPKGT